MTTFILTGNMQNKIKMNTQTYVLLKLFENVCLLFLKFLIIKQIITASTMFTETICVLFFRIIKCMLEMKNLH